MRRPTNGPTMREGRQGNKSSNCAILPLRRRHRRRRHRNEMVVFHLRAALSRILRSPSSLPSSSHAPYLVIPRRLLPSSSSFAVEDYLVSRLGLTHEQALKAATKISPLRSSAKPDALLAYLESTLGIPAADVGRAVVIEPRFLCTKVKTLAPRIADLHDLGLSREEIARLVHLAPDSFYIRFLRSKLEFWLAEFGSFDKLLQVLRWGTRSSILCVDLDKIIRPNVAFLRQYGLNISDFAGASAYNTRLFTMNPGLLKEAAQRVEELGLNCGARLLRQALPVVALTDKDALAKRIQLLHNIGLSKDDVLTLTKKQPNVLGLSEEKVQGNLDFLIKDVGLEVSYIVRRPALLKYSVERRLLPRHILIKGLNEKGLLKGNLDYYVTASLAEKIFVEKFVHPFKNHVPGLAEDYASKCLGEATDGIASPED